MTLSVAGFLLAGVGLGCLVGLLPGLGGATTIALLIPFILPLESQDAMALLIGVAAITATAGDMTSVLFGIPGESTSAATVLDGHPMTRRGEAGRAVGAALGSSLVGSLFGGLVLAVSIPLAGPVLRSFGSPELFMAAILGVSFVVPVAGSSRVKGLVAGGLGLWLSMVGLDPAGATPRFTGGLLYLWDGIGLIPATLGLFAIPEIVRLGGESEALEEIPSFSKGRGLREGFRNVATHWRLVLRCGAIGAGVGLLPGTGASVSQWLAYAHAARSTRPTTPFGSGAVEGVLGPASANNATLGGALVPTLALGVPASLSSAMLLSALVVKGLQPGPDMLLPESQGGHLGLVLSLVWLMVIGNVLAVTLCLAASGMLLRVTRIPGRLLVPFILSLTLLGAFAARNAFGDVIVMAVMAGLGLLMVHLEWPRVPLMIGLVLGTLAETRFFLSMDAYGTAWLLRPGVVIMGLVLAASVLAPRRTMSLGPSWATGRATERDPSRASLAFLGGLTVFLGSALMLTGPLSARAALFPRIVIATTLGLTLFELARAVWHIRQADMTPSPASVATNGTSWPVVAWVGAFVATIWLMGFVVGIPLAILGYLRYEAGQRVGRAALLAAGACVFVAVVMGRVLRLPFPVGSLLEWTMR